ncbi:MAG: hypothetical protein JO354_07585 [Verrucomicrobia bacterium]|nr:hypothetical protein [Verrucomicrobiota bacterium]
MNSRRIPLSTVCWLVFSITVQGQTVKSLNVVTNHILYEPVSGKIYASVPSSAGSNGNSIVTIDPTRPAIVRYVFIGSEPDVLAASDDGQFLYAGLDGADAVRRYTIATHSAGLQFSLGNGYTAADLKVLPGEPHSLAAALGYSVAIYDDGVQRPNVASGLMNSLALSNSAAVLYAQDTQDSAGTLFALAVNSTGVSVSNSANGELGGLIISDPGTDLIYDTYGGVADGKSLTLLGAFSQAVRAYNYYGTTSGAIGGIVPDAANGRVFFLVYDSLSQTNAVTIAAFDSATFMPVGSLVIPNVLTSSSNQGAATDLVPWGGDGLAFRTTNGQIWLVNGRTFPGLADFQLSATKVVGGATVTGTVALTRPAPPAVPLSISSPPTTSLRRQPA